MAKYTYNSNNGALNTLTYGTGQKISYGYDVFGNTKSIKYNGNTAFNFYTDCNGNITRSVDSINDIQYNSVFDTTGRLVRTTANSTTAESNKKFLYSTEYGYDLNNNITKLINKTPNATITNNYTYGKDNLLTKYKMTAGYIANYTYDGLNRLTKVSVDTNSPIDTSYTYYDSAREDGNYTTNLLETETIGGVTYEYSYDTLGNITDIYRKDGDKLKTLYNYEYDAMNQLIYVSDFESRKIYNYTYDNAGNIISEVVRNTNSNGVPISTTNNSYTYGDTNWTDKLTAYNGQVITYDAIGNPLTYRDGIEMIWKNGRELDTFTKGTTNVSYSNDSNSVRVSKTVDGVKYTYEYLNGKLLYETRGEAKFWYSYDSNGILYNIRYTLSDNSAMMSYYCTHNSRGDIVGIYNGDGVLRAQYKYDSWGNVLSVTDENGNAIISATHVGNLNPFRYRGYYYDTESGFYYLMSRYYDPVTHRFINADGYFQPGNSILDANMHLYCGNNPVSHSDTNGNSWFSDIAATVVKSALTAMAAICPWMGSNSSTSVSHTSETKLINSDYAPVNFRCGEKTTTNISTHTYSLGSPTVYYNQDLYSYSDNYGNRNSGITHTFGVKSLSLDISMSFGSDGVGFSYAKINGDISMYISYKKCNNFVTETEVGFTKWDNSTGTTVYLGGSSNSVTSSMLMYAASSIPSIVGAGFVFKVLIPALGG